MFKEKSQNQVGCSEATHQSVVSGGLRGTATKGPAHAHRTAEHPAAPRQRRPPVQGARPGLPIQDAFEVPPSHPLRSALSQTTCQKPSQLLDTEREKTPTQPSLQNYQAELGRHSRKVPA